MTPQRELVEHQLEWHFVCLQSFKQTNVISCLCTEMSWGKCPQTETARPKCPVTETVQTANVQTETAKPNRPDRNSQTVTAKPNRPDWKVLFRPQAHRVKEHISSFYLKRESIARVTLWISLWNSRVPQNPFQETLVYILTLLLGKEWEQNPMNYNQLWPCLTIATWCCSRKLERCCWNNVRW